MYTVLVVDDNDSIRRGLTLMLRNSGFRPLVAADGDEALAVSESVRPDLMLLDLTMPGRDGLSVLAALRADPMRAGLPVIVYSATDDPSVLRQVERLGAEFLPKGTTGWEKLVDRIRVRLATRHAPDGIAPYDLPFAANV